MVIANKPVKPVEKSIASPGLLAQLATHKYCNALSLYRQAQMFKRFGIELDHISLANWMIKCGVLIPPLINFSMNVLEKAHCFIWMKQPYKC